jgi:hypothetical protein
MAELEGRLLPKGFPATQLPVPSLASSSHINFRNATSQPALGTQNAKSETLIAPGFSNFLLSLPPPARRGPSYSQTRQRFDARSELFPAGGDDPIPQRTRRHARV